MPALRPIDPPYDPDIARLLEAYPKRDGYLLKLFRVLAVSKRHLSKTGAGGLLDRDSPLSMREREIVILRTTGRLRCGYEWGVHVTAFAVHVGLAHEQVAATVVRDSNGVWTDREALLVRVVDELCEHARLTAATLSEARAIWSEAQQLEIASLVGFYHTISFIVALAELEPEGWAAPFPDSR